MMQLEHSEIHNHSHKLAISLILEHLDSPQNIGLCIRTAEAMGVKRIYILSKHLTQISPKIKRITRSTEQYIDIIFCQDWDRLLSHISPKDTYFYALERTKLSIDHSSYSYKFPCAIICGNERMGVSDKALALASTHLHINMYGKNSSMNVAIATGICLASIVNQQS